MMQVFNDCPVNIGESGRDHPSLSLGASHLHRMADEAVMPLALEPWILALQTASSYRAAGRLSCIERLQLVEFVECCC